MEKYTHDQVTHNTKASEIITPYLMELISPKSVIDIGCGLGTWLQSFKSLGCEIKGADWPLIDRNLLLLDESEFIPIDLEKGISLGQKYDLAICLEVAEHISEKSSDIIVESLISLSDTILFSAAIPNQGGDNHINEQNYDYWRLKFERHGYFFYDLFREKYWENQQIEWWYKQNMFLVSKLDLQFEKCKTTHVYVHPELLQKKINEIEKFYNGNHSVLTGFKFFLKTVSKSFQKK